MVFVTKADGSKQPFKKKKIVRTCLRMHASPEIARTVADKVASRVYEGITTKKVMQMIFQFLREYKPEVRYEIDLREAISLLRPKPDFEIFVGELLRANGYEVQNNKIVKGVCVEHEIDTIAKKDDEIIYVEVKHHYQPHTYTGLSEFLSVNSTFEDLVDGFKSKKNSINFNRALLVCNTKISDHAKQYADCRGIGHVGWRDPENDGIAQMVEDKKLYPITFLKNLDAESQAKLGDNGIVLLKQMVEEDFQNLRRISGVKSDKLEDFVKKAREILKNHSSLK